MSSEGGVGGSKSVVPRWAGRRGRINTAAFGNRRRVASREAADRVDVLGSVSHSIPAARLRRECGAPASARVPVCVWIGVRERLGSGRLHYLQGERTCTGWRGAGDWRMHTRFAARIGGRPMRFLRGDCKPTRVCVMFSWGPTVGARFN